MNTLEPSKRRIGNRKGDVNIMSLPDKVNVTIAYHDKKEMPCLKSVPCEVSYAVLTLK